VIPFEFVIWDADECAEYLKVSKDRFLKSIRHRKGFPSPVTSDHEHPRWRAIYVAKWRVGEFTHDLQKTFVTA